jgi:hypothetical protein
MSTLHKIAGFDNLLDCYFAHLSDTHPKCLIVEVRGHKVATEPLPASLSCLRAALELYFDDFFSSGRVIWLAGDTEPFVRREIEQWANAWRLTSYRDEEGAREVVDRVLHGR